MGPPKPIERLGHLSGGGLRISGMPMRALPTPSADDGPRFHLNMPISELIELNTQVVEASVVSSAPLVVETEDRVTHETRPTPIKPQGARGLKPLDPRSKDQGLKADSRRARGRLVSNKEPGGKHR